MTGQGIRIKTSRCAVRTATTYTTQSVQSVSHQHSLISRRSVHPRRLLRLQAQVQRGEPHPHSAPSSSISISSSHLDFPSHHISLPLLPQIRFSSRLPSPGFSTRAPVSYFLLTRATLTMLSNLTAASLHLMLMWWGGSERGEVFYWAYGE